MPYQFTARLSKPWRAFPDSTELAGSFAALANAVHVDSAAASGQFSDRCGVPAAGSRR